MKTHFTTMANYNIWANKTLYSAVEELSAEEFTKDIGAFFGSVMGTLNHILVGDMAWLHRIDGKGQNPAALNSILHEDFDGLWQARQQMDHRILETVSTLEEARFDTILSYKTIAGAAQETHMSHVLTHVFNHQTHHRGQCHQSLSQLGKNPPPLDLIYYLRSLKA